MMNGIRGWILCGATLALGSGTALAGVDAKLLDMLLANGSITKAQHSELSRDLVREERAEKRTSKQKLDKKEFTAFQQLAGWTANTKLTGDMRVRNDYINVEDERKSGGRDKDRQRIRARLAAVTQVNPEVEVGIQVASGNSADRRSTNQDMDAFADKKALWLDLGYIDYHPLAVPGLKLFAGKMKQPWISMADLAWDNDINPEGFAVQYVRKSGTNTFTSSASYMILKDNVDGDGVEWDNDLAVYTGQLAYAFDPADTMRLTLGVSINDFSNEEQQLPSPPETVVALRANGNTTDAFRLYEGFGQLDVIGLPLPLTLYSQYVVNDASRDFLGVEDGGEDTAWLLGLRTNVAGVALDYTYRDVERNAVVGTLTDSDFASGYTGSSGHKIKAQYDFLKNFNLSVSWFLAESDAASRFKLEDAEVQTLMIDLNAKF
jgi:polyhydroxyalkanoate synthesis regulator phasin